MDIAFHPRVDDIINIVMVRGAHQDSYWLGHVYLNIERDFFLSLALDIDVLLAMHGNDLDDLVFLMIASHEPFLAIESQKVAMFTS